MTTVRLLPGLALLAALSTLAVLLPASAFSRGSCSFEGGILDVELTSTSSSGFFSTASDGSIFNGQCFSGSTDPTIFNVNRIDIDDRSREGQLIQLQLENNLLAPGLTDEGDGSSEIEMLIDLGLDDSLEATPGNAAGDYDELDVSFPGARAHEIHIGRVGGDTWLNLNAGQELGGSEDLDIRLRGLNDFSSKLSSSGRGFKESIQLKTYRGDDRILAGGGPGLASDSGAPLLIRAGAGDNTVAGSSFADSLNADSGNDLFRGRAGNDYLGPARGNDVLKGGTGNDEMDGGAGNDKLVGGPGKDEMIGKGGRDVFEARDGKKDTIDCGPGKDKVFADRKDKVKRSCEKVKRRR